MLMMHSDVMMILMVVMSTLRHMQAQPCICPACDEFRISNASSWCSWILWRFFFLNSSLCISKFLIKNDLISISMHFSFWGQLLPHAALSLIHFTAMSSSALPTVDKCAASLQREGYEMLWIIELCSILMNCQSMSVPELPQGTDFFQISWNSGRSRLHSQSWSCPLESKKRPFHCQAGETRLIVFKCFHLSVELPPIRCEQSSWHEGFMWPSQCRDVGAS